MKVSNPFHFRFRAGWWVVLWLLCGVPVWAQQGSTYVSIRVKEVCAYKGEESTNEFSWKMWVDGSATTLCITEDRDNLGCYNRNNQVFVNSRYYSSFPASIGINLYAWEDDDCGDRCDHNTCPWPINNGDDDDLFASGKASFNLSDYAPGVWQTLPLKEIQGDGHFGFLFEIYYTAPVPNQPQLLVDGNPYSAATGTVCADRTLGLTPSVVGNTTGITYEWQYHQQGDPLDYYPQIDNPKYCGPCEDEIGMKKPKCCFEPETITSDVLEYKWRTYDNQSQKIADAFPGITASTSFDFRVRARAGSSISNWSNEVKLPVNPAGPTFTLTALPPSCLQGTDGSLVLGSITGVVGQYKCLVYLPGKTTPENAIACQNGPFTIRGGDGNILPLEAGKTYRVKLLNNGLSGSCASEELFITIPAPVIADLQLSLLEKKDLTCFGAGDGLIRVAAAGGKGAYTYEISPGSLPASATGTFNNLPPGTYTITVRDSCTSTATVTSITLAEPTRVTATFTTSPPKCFGENNGTLRITAAAAGSGQYTYQLKQNGQLLSEQVNTTATSWEVNTLPDGSNYQITVVDAQRPACAGFAQTFALAQPAPIQLALSNQQNLLCAGSNEGSIRLTGSGGTGSYQYTLEPARGSQTSPGNFSGLSAGSYQATVRDGNGCLSTASFTISAPNPLVVRLTERRDVTCWGDDDGSAGVAVEGGAGSYRYTWQVDGVPLAGNVSARQNLSPGSYRVVVSDAQGCQVVQTFTILEPAALTATFDNIRALVCSDVCDGAIGLIASGGTAPYFYQWNDPAGQTTARAQNLCPGMYTVTVTDAKGCSFVNQHTLAAPQALTVELGGPYTLCQGQVLNLDAGVDNITYRWELPEGLTSNERQISINKGGRYVLTVTSPKGCVARDTATVQTLDTAFEVNFLAISQPTVGESVQFQEVCWPKPDRLAWDFGTAAQVINADPAGPVVTFPSEGAYTITLTAYLGECVATRQKTITLSAFHADKDITSAPSTDYPISVVVFPNPNSGVFQVKVEMQEMQTVDMALFDVFGYRITAQTEKGADHYLTAFDVQSLPSGIYVLKLITPHQQKHIRVVVN